MKVDCVHHIDLPATVLNNFLKITENSQMSLINTVQRTVVLRISLKYYLLSFYFRWRINT